MTDDEHRLQPDHHPTPFSAAEIRDAFVVGREVRTLTVRVGAEPYVHVRRDLAADAEAGVYEVWTESLEGAALTDREQGRSTWLELQGHASMPIETTTIEEQIVDVPMGRYPGKVYRRSRGDTVDTFWFAMSRPGAPVGIESRVGDEVVFSAKAISERRPD